MATLSRGGSGSPWILTLRSGASTENTFRPEVVSDVNALLDRVLQEHLQSGREEGGALVVTGGRGGKFFCNGHDIQWLVAAAGRGDGSAEAFLHSFYCLVARLWTFPMPTVAAINGHAFAGGCLLALAMDYRVMRGDKGFLCMNEIDMALAPPPPPSAAGAPGGLRPGMFKNADRKMVTILQARLPPHVVRDMFLQGLRLNAQEAHRLGVVDVVAAAGEDPVMTEATALATKLGAKCPARNRRTWFVLKYEMLGPHAVDVLTDGKGLKGTVGGELAAFL